MIYPSIFYNKIWRIARCFTQLYGTVWHMAPQFLPNRNFNPFATESRSVPVYGFDACGGQFGIVFSVYNLLQRGFGELFELFIGASLFGLQFN